MQHRTVRRILVGGAERELMEVRFADEDRARLPQATHHRGIAPGDVTVSYARCRGRWRVAKIDDVLERNRDAMKRAAIPARSDLLIGFFRLRYRVVVQHADERVERSILLRYPLEASLGHRLGCQSFRRDQAANIGQGARLSGHVRRAAWAGRWLPARARAGSSRRRAAKQSSVQVLPTAGAEQGGAAGRHPAARFRARREVDPPIKGTRIAVGSK